MKLRVCFGRVLRSSWLTLSLLAIAVTTVPTAHAITQDGQSWSTLMIQGPVSSKFRAYFEFQPRFGSDFSRLERVLVRPALSYYLNPDLSFWLGYAWTPLYSPRYINEQRLWQQVQYTSKCDRISLLNRARLEERFIENVPETAWRFRYMLRALFAVGESRLWSLVSQNEIFFHLNSVNRGPQAGYDQVRSLLGINRFLSKQVSLEGGYMLNHVNNASPQEDRLNHIVQLTAFLAIE